MGAIGWGRTFNALDDFMAQMNNLGRYSYNNFYPFKSQSGKWYAFHNEAYSDVKVKDLATGQVVATNIYSNMSVEPRVYGHHANFATYVPCYFADGDISVSDRDFDEWLADGSLKPEDLERLEFVPVAFNAWTVWAADWEFYVDMLDLSRIDEGAVEVIKSNLFIMPRDGVHVRDFVATDAEYWIPIRKQEEPEDQWLARQAAPRNVTVDFRYLDEKHRDRFKAEKGVFDMNDGTAPYQPEERPWVSLQRRIEDSRKKSA